MDAAYKTQIAAQVRALLLQLGVDPDIQMDGRPPTMASSEFLTNREQGDWAEDLVLNAINKCSGDFCAVKYGRADGLSAGDEGFDAFYAEYQTELNQIGKRPDILIFRKEDLSTSAEGQISDTDVERAVAAIEVRSSAFRVDRYADFMAKRTQIAQEECCHLRAALLQEPWGPMLQEKSTEIHRLIRDANHQTFRDLDFRLRSWSSSPDLRELSQKLKQLKAQIKILHRRDYLSITPKVEDLALVSRWIQRFGVRHFYLQVFFDKAFVIPFQQIIDTASDSEKEGSIFTIEKDVKNQGKSTIKTNIQVGQEIIGRIDMPEHYSAMKELDRGRLLFYVRFRGGVGYLDKKVFEDMIRSHA